MKKINLGLVILLLFLGACARTVPGQPQSVSVARVSSGLLVTWKDNSSGDLQETGFVIKRNGKKIADKGPNITQHLDEFNVIQNETYSYQVCAVIDGKEVCSTEAKYPDTSSGEKVTLTIFRELEGDGSGFIKSNPEGINCNHNSGSGCSGQFNKGTTVTLTAIPDDGSVFAGWSDNCNEDEANTLSCKITINKNETVGELLIKGGPGLNIGLLGDSNAGVVVDLNTAQQIPPYQYINCGSDCNEPVEVDSTFVLEAQPAADSIFGGWGECANIEGGTLGNRCRVSLKPSDPPFVLNAKFFKNTSKPTIDTFTAAPDKFATGQSGDVTLAWKINALTPSAVTDISISDGTNEVCTTDTLDLEDSCLVASVAASTTFTLTVDSAFGPETATATVTVGDVAAITKFEVVDKPGSEIKIAKGETVTLSWGVAGKEPLTIILSNDKGSASEAVTDNGSKDVTPSATTVYTLTADNDFGGPVSQSITIIVGDKPVINSFKVDGGDTANVVVGGKATLTWGVTPLDSTITFKPSIGTFTGNSQELEFPETGVFTYELTASNDFGESEPKLVTIQVGIEPEITKFTINDSDGSEDNVPIAKGDSAAIEWSVEGSGTDLDVKIRRDGAVINDAAGRTGSLTDGPLDDTGTITYRVTATNAFGGSVSKDIKVDVGDKPAFSTGLIVIETSGDEANDGIIVLGDSATLSWSLLGSESTTFSISPIGTVPGPNSHVVSPTSTTSYTLTATNRFGSTDSGPVEVTVVTPAPPEPPIISRFRAKPVQIDEGESTTLDWKIEGTPPIELTLDDGDEATEPLVVTGTDEITLSPSKTTTYTLTAKNEVDTDTETVTVTVREPPDIRSFLGNPTELIEGESSMLSWDVVDEDSLSLLPLGTVNGDGITIMPIETTIYTLIATNTAGSTQSEDITITVLPLAPPDPPVITFSATPEIIPEGNQSILNWEVSGTPPFVLMLDDGTGPTEVTGDSLEVSPLLTTTYTLNAMNDAGEDSKSVTVVVEAPVISSFSATPETLSVDETSTLAWVVEGTLPMTLNLEPALGDVSILSQIEVMPEESVTYTLTATNILGSVSSQVTLTVNPLEP